MTDSKILKVDAWVDGSMLLYMSTVLWIVQWYQRLNVISREINIIFEMDFVINECIVVKLLFQKLQFYHNIKALVCT